MELRSESCTVQLNDRTGALASWRANHAPEQEFLVERHGEGPLFVVQYLDPDGRLRQASSLEASAVAVRRGGGGGEAIGISYRGIGEPGLSATAVVRRVAGDPALYWDFAATLASPCRVLNVQFPYLVARYDLGGDRPGTRLLRPLMEGRLYQGPRPHQFAPDHPELWQLLPVNGDSDHYPGQTFAQFLAYYNARAGLLIACRDPAGGVKLIRPVHREPGLRLGIAHVVGWTAAGEHDLGYSVATEAFRGDWYDAAELYRGWSLRQPWARTSLAQRADLPTWLADSPFHVAMRVQGELDAGPTGTHAEFTPFENALPLLDAAAARLDSALVPVLMAWERAGPWVYPDCFPPVGGADSLVRFAAAARARGWHVGTYSNGTRWSTAHRWSGYDGGRFFAENGGPQSVCRQPDGRPWPSGWDQHWRPSYTGCVGAARTRELLREYARTLLEAGLDWIQILDQNVGGAAFPCYADDHGHGPAPGRWMTERMNALLAEVRSPRPDPGRAVVWAVEGPCAECYLPSFVLCDVRPDPRAGFVPLYHYLYHDRILTQAIFARAPNPHFLVVKCARSFVLGDVLGCCMGRAGRLQNWEPPPGEPWMEWDRPAGDQDAAYALFRDALALRRGVGRDFLVFGRLLRPRPVEGVAQVAWTLGPEAHSIPALEHATWQAPDGRTAVALANWTDRAQAAVLDLAVFGGQPGRLHVSSQGVVTSRQITLGRDVAVSIPAGACALLIAAG
jgi:hypothetical protein